MSEIIEKDKKKNKIKVNLTIDDELFLRLTLMRNYFFLNWSNITNEFLWDTLKSLEERLKKNKPEDYKKYLKDFTGGNKES